MSQYLPEGIGQDKPRSDNGSVVSPKREKLQLTEKESEIRAGLEKVKEDQVNNLYKLEDFTKKLTSPDSQMLYQLNKLDLCESLLEQEVELGSEIEEIYSRSRNEDDLAVGLAKLNVPAHRIYNFFLNHSLCHWVNHGIKELQVANRQVQVSDQAASSIVTEKHANAKVSQLKTRESILRSMQGLPPVQQILDYKEAAIVLGISVSKFNILRKEGIIPAPLRISGKGRGVYYLLETISALYMPARRKSAFKPKW